MDKERLIAQLEEDLRGRYLHTDNIRPGILRAVEKAWDRAEAAEG